MNTQEANQYLIQRLAEKITALGYRVELSKQYVALTVNESLELATAIVDNPNYHPNVLHLLIYAINEAYFPKGIEENVVGIGSTMEEKVEFVLENYLGTTFQPILASLSDEHFPPLDFMAEVGGKQALWHPKLGMLSLMGKWEQVPEGEPIYDLLKNDLQNGLSNQKINWLKIFLARQADGSVNIELLLNNQIWEAPALKLRQYVQTWGQSGVFLAQKQFMTFRRCDKFDE